MGLISQAILFARGSGNLADVPIRQTVTACVVSDECEIIDKPEQKVAENWDFPVVLKMTKPMR
jgi:hypothetical protein